jgi:hypothetical protein
MSKIRSKKNKTTKNTHKKSVFISTINYSDIKEPKTVEEFRRNLLRYYYSVGKSIYVSELGMVDVNKINNIIDLVEMVKNKFPNKATKLSLTPKVVETVNWKKYVEDNSTLSYYDNVDILQMWWNKNETHKIITTNDFFLKESQRIMGNVFWKNILEKKELYQYFHQRVMGKFGIYDDFGSDKPYNHLIFGSINIGGFGEYKITKGGFIVNS